MSDRGTRRLIRRAAALLLAALACAAALAPAALAAPPDPAPVAGGAFFAGAQANGLGFAVRNYADGPDFFSAYQRLGGVETLGPPVSRPWVDDGGFVYQLVQRALLQWSPADGRVRLANIFELLDDAAFADALRARHVPAAESPAPAEGQTARGARLAWLTDRVIAEAFANNPLAPGNLDASLEFHGLPTSRPVRFGPFVVQRFQRTALQRWVEEVEGGQPPGVVVLVNAGDIFRDLRLPDARLDVPRAPSEAGVLDVRQDPPQEAALAPGTATLGAYAADNLELLAALGLLEGVAVNADALALASQLNVAMRFAPLPNAALAQYNPAGGVRVSERLRGADTRVLAVVLAHELRHLEDHARGLLDASRAGCLAAETRALAREARTWMALTSPNGLQPASSDLQRMQNARAAVYAAGPAAVDRLAVQVYGETCAAWDTAPAPSPPRLPAG